MKKNKINISEKFPFPFKIEAINKNNKKDVEKARLLLQWAKYEWNNGGQEEFLRKFGSIWVNNLIKKL